MADAMLDWGTNLRREFAAWRQAHPDLAADAKARLQSFINRSSCADGRQLIYPIGRELQPAAER